MTATATFTATSSPTATLTATNTEPAPSETATATLTSVASTETLVPSATATMEAEISSGLMPFSALNPVETISIAPNNSTNSANMFSENTFAVQQLQGTVINFFDDLEDDNFDQGFTFLNANAGNPAISGLAPASESDALDSRGGLARSDVNVNGYIPNLYLAFGFIFDQPYTITNADLQIGVSVLNPSANGLINHSVYMHFYDNSLNYLGTSYVCNYQHQLASEPTFATADAPAVCDFSGLPNFPVGAVAFEHVKINALYADLYEISIDDISLTLEDSIPITATPTHTATYTPTPTATATQISCPAQANSAQANEISAFSDNGEECPDPDIEQQLEEYGIVTEGDWSLLDLSEMLQGVENVGLAFQAFSTQIYASPQEAFKEVMLLDSATQHILLVKLSPPNDDEFCTTNTVPDGVQRASITCGGSNLFSEYTMVHELGHVFLNQTIASIPVNTSAMPCHSAITSEIGFIFCMENPRDDTNGGALRGIPLDTFVFGFVSRIQSENQLMVIVNRFDPSGSYNVSANDFSYSYADGETLDLNTGLCTNNRPPTTIVSDWERGEKGWDGVELEGFGACANANGDYTISDFQQNPCNIIDWILQASPSVDNTTLSEIKVVEQEEAGADMFLNWVYRSVDSTSNAFSDNKDQNTGLYQGSEGPGDDRFFWMQDKLNEFLSYYQW